MAIGILTSLMANINRDPDKRAEPFVASDFMVDWEKRLEAAAPKPDTPEPEEEDGMSAERVRAVMGSFMKQQREREEKKGKTLLRKRDG